MAAIATQKQNLNQRAQEIAQKNHDTILARKFSTLIEQSLSDFNNNGYDARDRSITLRAKLQVPNGNQTERHSLNVKLYPTRGKTGEYEVFTTPQGSNSLKNQEQTPVKIRDSAKLKIEALLKDMTDVNKAKRKDIETLAESLQQNPENLNGFVFRGIGSKKTNGAAILILNKKVDNTLINLSVEVNKGKALRFVIGAVEKFQGKVRPTVYRGNLTTRTGNVYVVNAENRPKLYKAIKALSRLNKKK